MILPDIGLPGIETEIRISSEIKAGDRAIYAVARITILRIWKGHIAGGWTTPLALLIIEPGEQYAVSIKGEKMDLAEIMEMAPSLKEVVEMARRGQGPG